MDLSSRFNRFENLSENDSILLLIAAKYGRIDILEQLIFIYSDVEEFDWNLQNKYGLTALMIATKENQFDFVHLLLSVIKSTDLNLKCHEGLTAIAYAAMEGHLEIVKALIPKQNLDNLQLLDNCGQTLLNWAAKHNYSDIVELLISRFIQLNHEISLYPQDNSGCTPLDYAIQKQNTEIISKLLPYCDAENLTKIMPKSKPETVDEFDGDYDERDDENVLFFAANKGHINIIEALISQFNKFRHIHFSKYLNIKDDFGFTALTYVLHNDHINIAQALIPYIERSCMIELLYKSIQTDRRKITNLLLSELLRMNEDIDFVIKDKVNRTPLDWAATNGNVKLIKYIIFYIAKKEPQCTINALIDSAFIYAVGNGQLEAMDALYANYTENRLNATDNYGHTAMILAAKNGNNGALKFLLTYFLDNVDDQDKNRMTPLMHAAGQGHYSIVKMLLSKKANSALLDGNENTTLMHAILSGNLDVFDSVLNAINDKEMMSELILGSNLDYSTPIIMAAEYGYSDIIEKILSHLREDKIRLRALQAQDDRGRNALMMAALKGHLPVVKILISQKASLNQLDNQNQPALHYAILGGNLGVIDRLLPFYLDENKIDHANDFGQTALILASMQGLNSIVETLLVYQADPDLRDVNGFTALMLAIQNHHEETAHCLIEKLDLDLIDNQENNNSDTLLTLAAQVGMVSVVQLLLSKGADIHLRTINSQSALYFAILNNDVELIDVLIPFHEPTIFNTYDYLGLTPFLYAASVGSVASLNCLVVHAQNSGIVPNLLARDNEGLNTLMLACKGAHIEMIKALIPYFNPAQLVETDSNMGKTVLMLACQFDSDFILKVLLPHFGLNELNFEDQDGMTALMRACKEKRITACNALIARYVEIDPLSLIHQNSQGKTTLSYATESEDVSMVKTLYPYYDIKMMNMENKLLLCSLMEASIIVGNLAMVKFLTPYLERDDLLNSKTHSNKSFIMLACRFFSVEVLEFLIDQKIDLNHRDRDGNTALLISAVNNHPKAISILIPVLKDADLNAINVKGLSVLTYLIVFNNFELLDMLLSAKKIHINGIDLAYAVGNKNKAIRYRLTCDIQGSSSPLIESPLFTDYMLPKFKDEFLWFKKWLFHTLGFFRKHSPLENELIAKIVSNIYPKWYYHLENDHMKRLFIKLEDKLAEHRYPTPAQITLEPVRRPLIMSANIKTNNKRKKRPVEFTNSRYPRRIKSR